MSFPCSVHIPLTEHDNTALTASYHWWQMKKDSSSLPAHQDMNIYRQLHFPDSHRHREHLRLKQDARTDNYLFQHILRAANLSGEIRCDELREWESLCDNTAAAWKHWTEAFYACVDMLLRTDCRTTNALDWRPEWDPPPPAGPFCLLLHCVRLVPVTGCAAEQESLISPLCINGDPSEPNQGRRR